MKVEKNPTVSEPKEAENFERKNSPEDLKMVAECLNDSNRNFFEKMSQGGREIAAKAYEGIYKTPGVNRLAGKMEIAYNQFWADSHEKKAAKLKSEMDGVDLGVGQLEKSKKQMEATIENLKQRGMPGAESLMIKMKEIDRQKVKMLNKKDKVQTKFEAKDNKVKLYTNKRDAIADKLIGRYNEKLEPMEKNLETLRTEKDHLDLLTTATEIRHKEAQAELDNIKKEKDSLEEAFRLAGMSDRKIGKDSTLKIYDEMIKQKQEEMRKEKEKIEKQKIKLDAKIAKADAKANPYRDKKEEFARVKGDRPIKMEVPTRKRNKEFSEKEEIKTHPRERIPEVAENELRDEVKEEKEQSQESQEGTALSCVVSWNEYMKQKYSKEDLAKNRGAIDLKDFLKSTNFWENSKLDPQDFKNVLKQYLKYKKIPADIFNKHINEFVEKSTKA